MLIPRVVVLIYLKRQGILKIGYRNSTIFWGVPFEWGDVHSFNEP
jgi:hypothetical protein